MVELLIAVVKEKKVEKSIKLISTLDDLNISQHKFLTPHTETFVNVFTELIGTEDIDVAIKIAAVNFLSNFSVNNSTALRKSQIFNQKTLIVLYQ